MFSKYFSELESQNNVDCGVMAIAFAASVLRGTFLDTIRFQYEKLRPHLTYILKNYLIEPFPLATRKNKYIP